MSSTADSFAALDSRLRALIRSTAEDRAAELPPDAGPERPSLLWESMSTVGRVPDKFPKSGAKSLIKEGAKAQEYKLLWIKPRLTSATPADTATRLKFKSPGDLIWGSVQSSFLSSMRSSDDSSIKTLGWILTTAKLVLQVRKATPIGAAIEFGFFAYDVINEVADKIDRENEQKIQNETDLPLQDFVFKFRDVRRFLRESYALFDPEYIRNGGITIVFDGMVEMWKHQKMPTPVFKQHAKNYFLSKGIDIVDGVEQLIIAISIANAWAHKCGLQARDADNNRSWGRPDWTGKVDKEQRRDFGLSGRRFLLRERDMLLERIKALAMEADYALAWHRFFDQ